MEKALFMLKSGKSRSSSLKGNVLKHKRIEKIIRAQKNLSEINKLNNR